MWCFLLESIVVTILAILIDLMSITAWRTIGLAWRVWTFLQRFRVTRPPIIRNELRKGSGTLPDQTPIRSFGTSGSRRAAATSRYVFSADARKTRYALARVRWASTLNVLWTVHS